MSYETLVSLEKFRKTEQRLFYLSKTQYIPVTIYIGIDFISPLQMKQEVY